MHSAATRIPQAVLSSLACHENECSRVKNPALLHIHVSSAIGFFRGPLWSHTTGIKSWKKSSTRILASAGEADVPVEAKPDSAKVAVETGIELFKKGRVREALSLFDSALNMSPTPEEAQAALYNKACCHASREEPNKAAEALQLALAKYDLAFSVILSDPDMAPFRATKEFTELRKATLKGGEEVGDSFRRDLKLISEVQAPFRPVRKFLYVALSAAAGISTVFTLPRLIRALGGGDGAPELAEVATDLAINLGGITLFVALWRWEQGKEEEQLSRVSRDETLSRLPLRLRNDRVLELSQLRQSRRPVIIAGSKASVSRAMQRAEKFRTELMERGVLLVPLVWSEAGASPLAKGRGFGVSPRKPPTVPLPPSNDGFDEKVVAIAAKGVMEEDRKFSGEPISPGAWEEWVKEQQEATEGIKPGEDVYIILRLDGRVRKSGKGSPNWEEIVTELPRLDALVSKLER